MSICLLLFFFNDTATTEIYTLSLHDALPICTGVAAVSDDWDEPLARKRGAQESGGPAAEIRAVRDDGRRRVDDLQIAGRGHRDRKSTRLNSSHANISYAVFCLKKKKSSGMRI